MADDEVGVRVVKVPTIREAIEMRNRATEFEGPYVPSEGPRLHCLPAFDPDPDGIHVLMEADGVRGRLLPVCARGCAKAIELYLLDVRKYRKLASFEKGPLQTGYQAEVTEDMQEIGGFGFFTENYETYVHLHSITTGRGVVFGPLSYGDQQEFHDRLRAAFERLPPNAVEKSIVKLNIQAPPTRVVQSWEHGEHPPELG